MKELDELEGHIKTAEKALLWANDRIEVLEAALRSISTMDDGQWTVHAAAHCARLALGEE